MSVVIPCAKCDEPFEKWHPMGRVCKKCTAKRQRDYMRVYRAARPGFEKDRFKRRTAQNPQFLEDKRRRGREYWRQLKHEALMAYGGYKCACCGERQPHFLSIDHINNDGAAHRREIGNEHGRNFSKWLKDNGYPPGFQVLCFNCNFGKAVNGGICPHEDKSA